jgi:hypothetical protein
VDEQALLSIRTGIFRRLRQAESNVAAIEAASRYAHLEIRVSMHVLDY